MLKNIPMTRMSSVLPAGVTPNRDAWKLWYKTIRKSEGVARSLEEATEYIDKAVGIWKPCRTASNGRGSKK